MLKLKKFQEWIKLRELAQKPEEGENVELVTKAIQQMPPNKPGQTPADQLKDPEQQKKILQKTAELANQEGKKLNIGAAASALNKDNMKPGVK